MPAIGLIENRAAIFAEFAAARARAAAALFP